MQIWRIVYVLLAKSEILIFFEIDKLMKIIYIFFNCRLVVSLINEYFRSLVAD